jgi:hypothetical protein
MGIAKSNYHDPLEKIQIVPASMLSNEHYFAEFFAAEGFPWNNLLLL